MKIVILLSILVLFAGCETYDGTRLSVETYYSYGPQPYYARPHHYHYHYIPYYTHHIYIRPKHKNKVHPKIKHSDKNHRIKKHRH